MYVPHVASALTSFAPPAFSAAAAAAGLLVWLTFAATSAMVFSAALRLLGPFFAAFRNDFDRLLTAPVSTSTRIATREGFSRFWLSVFSDRQVFDTLGTDAFASSTRCREPACDEHADHQHAKRSHRQRQICGRLRPSSARKCASTHEDHLSRQPIVRNRRYADNRGPAREPGGVRGAEIPRETPVPVTLADVRRLHDAIRCLKRFVAREVYLDIQAITRQTHRYEHSTSTTGRS